MKKKSFSKLVCFWGKTELVNLTHEPLGRVAISCTPPLRFVEYIRNRMSYERETWHSFKWIRRQCLRKKWWLYHLGWRHSDVIKFCSFFDMDSFWCRWAWNSTVNELELAPAVILKHISTLPTSVCCCNYSLCYRENITFLISEGKFFELYGIFTVAFIKYKKILAHYWLWKRCFFARRKQYFQYICNNHGNFHVLLYKTIRSVWRFCYIKRRVGFQDR